MEHVKWHYRSLDDVRDELKKIGQDIPLDEDTSVIGTPCSFQNVKLHNRLGIAPMEGVDSLPDGSPSQMTEDRYVKLAQGGAGLIWMEAVSVVPEGRSSLKQLYLDDNNLDSYKRMIEKMKEAGLKENGFEPYIVMQANHSGRYSRPNPETRPEPIVAYMRHTHDKRLPADESCIATDEYLSTLPERFEEATARCKAAGFDAVDIKSCHGYLFDELASAYFREGKYGGSFENRFRLLYDCIRGSQVHEDKDFTVTIRLNICDMLPYPYGFGMKKEEGSMEADFTEPKRLVKELHEDLHVPFINFTMGDPHLNSHVTRPLDIGFTTPPEHPLEGVARMYNGIRLMKEMCPTLGVSASAPTYMRQFGANLAAGAINQGVCDQLIFGRLSMANPNFPKEMIETGTLATNHVCLTCSKCSELILAGVPTGCVIRNSETYLPIWKKLHEND